MPKLLFVIDFSIVKFKINESYYFAAQLKLKLPVKIQS